MYSVLRVQISSARNFFVGWLVYNVRNGALEPNEKLNARFWMRLKVSSS